jgi:hypothetical protein
MKSHDHIKGQEVYTPFNINIPLEPFPLICSSCLVSPMAQAAQPDFQMLQEHLQGVAIQLNNMYQTILARFNRLDAGILALQQG